MDDLSKRLREMAVNACSSEGMTVDDMVAGLTEAADALDARDAEVRRLKRIIYLYCDPMDMPPTDSLVAMAVYTEMNSTLPDEETPEDA